jgi:hypothetical protein
VTATPDPLRRLAIEIGGLLGELGVRPGDGAWAREEAGTIASLVEPSRLPRPLARLAALVRRLLRAAR